MCALTQELQGRCWSDLGFLSWRRRFFHTEILHKQKGVEVRDLLSPGDCSEQLSSSGAEEWRVCVRAEGMGSGSARMTEMGGLLLF